ncbi:hypothetical protein CWS35_24660 [Bradyrhizobium sp. SK17]|uniref:hypothetical protein n=1 Tax=Bradyrhizobium sp. SK17 TaxID=2057741 RepID=UPI000C3018F5|nr:hypothetical protein [Bradyrhizobium sp. SK17]AUC97079.1 hypothetical protein CWS35_24660 [Bradyrhizobium sp. SK17]
MLRRGKWGIESRLRWLERNAPTPWTHLTLVNTTVAPNLDSTGVPVHPPIELGVGEIIRTRRDQPSIQITFAEPRADLLGVNLGQWTDEQIAALAPSTCGDNRG